VGSLLEVQSKTGVRWRGNFGAVVGSLSIWNGEPEVGERDGLSSREEFPLDVRAGRLAECMGASTDSILEPETPALRGLAETAD